MIKDIRVEAVVWDIDGTMLNTFEHIVQAFELVLPQFGVTRNRDEVQAVIGKTLQDCYREFLPEADAVVAAEMHHQAQQTPEMYALITAYDSLHTTFDWLKQKGIKNAVQTNRSRRSVDLIFKHVGLEGAFDQEVSPDDVKHPKPNPEGTLQICRNLAVDPARTIIVGDTSIDVMTGKNAGLLATIAVSHGFGTEESLRSAGADYLIESLSELTDVITRIEA